MIFCIFSIFLFIIQRLNNKIQESYSKCFIERVIKLVEVLCGFYEDIYTNEVYHDIIEEIMQMMN